MLRNVPIEYSQDELLDELISYMGPDMEFDFFYLALQAGVGSSQAFAFINFCNPRAAEKAFNVFRGYQWKTHLSFVNAKVVFAHVQGLDNNLRHVRKKAVSRSANGPLVFSRGQRIDLQQVLAKMEAQGCFDQTGSTRGASPRFALPVAAGGDICPRLRPGLLQGNVSDLADPASFFQAQKDDGASNALNQLNLGKNFFQAEFGPGGCKVIVVPDPDEYVLRKFFNKFPFEV